jgi:hypothetical protein
MRAGRRRLRILQSRWFDRQPAAPARIRDQRGERTRFPVAALFARVDGMSLRVLAELRPGGFLLRPPIDRRNHASFFFILTHS